MSGLYGAFADSLCQVIFVRSLTEHVQPVEITKEDRNRIIDSNLKFIMNYNITPKSLILSLFEASPDQTVRIKFLIFVGDLFGFTGNTIRVTTTRLIREGYVNCDGRGQYRISNEYEDVIRFTRGWELGESRLIPWDKSWICCYIPQLPTRSKEKTHQALDLMGFQEGMTRFWVRPNNLKHGFEGVKKCLLQMNIHPNARLFISRDFEKDLTVQWQSYLWFTSQIADNQTKQTEKLKNSARKIDSLTTEDALIETYLLGNEAIRLLHTDPLLPKEIMTSKYRQQLTQAMLDYNELGKQIWERKIQQILGKS